MILIKQWKCSTKVQHLFLAFISQFNIYCATYCALCFAVVKEHIITAAIVFSCQYNSLLINDAPVFKVVAYNFALFDSALFNLELFDAVLFDVELS